MKRLFCWAVTAAMLLSVIVVPAGAVSFTDADEIVYTEAVEKTAQMGLFSGSDGKFLPKATVTRAQMATIIVKMLFGADVNADPFKGEGKFSDVADFEGGWAEGYVNLCAQTGVVSGYGDGTFQPGKAVTAAEAVTMIINALEIDAGEGSWPNTVMTKAAEMQLFGIIDPVPEADTVLIRDQLAVVVLAGIAFEPEGKKGTIVDGQLLQPSTEQENEPAVEEEDDEDIYSFPAIPFELLSKPSEPEIPAESQNEELTEDHTEMLPIT